MAPLQTVPGNGGGYVNSYTKSITPTAGNTLIISLACGAADTITVSDDKGNTWALGKVQILTSQRQVNIWYAYNVAAGATTITFQANAGQYPDSAVIIDEWGSVPTTDPLDKTVGANVTSGTSYASGNTAATTQASEFLVGALACDTNSPGFTGDASYATLLTQAGSDLYTSVTRQYKSVTSSGAYGWTVTNASSQQASLALATFKSTVPVNTSAFFALF